MAYGAPNAALSTGSVPFINSSELNVVLPTTVGTVTAPGAGTAVVVANTAVTATSQIMLTPKTPGGTQAGWNITSITPGTGFSVTFGSSDTTVYNYAILG